MQVRKQLYLLRERNVRAMRSGGSLMSVSLADRTGAVQGIYFDVPSHVAQSLTVGRGAEVSGQVGEYREQLQIKIEHISPAKLPNLEDYLPVARRPLDEMEQEFQALWASVQEPDLARLLDTLFQDERLYASFTRAPAAKRNHHACIGGLLEHTLAVARLVVTACDLYPELDRDLVVTVALLHDLGKLDAYDATSFDLTEVGALWTHLYRGASRVEHAIGQLAGFDPELRLRVIHAILAHHGRLEAGSPVVPMTLEAIVLHHADHLDGDARGALDHYDRQGGDGAFTERSLMLDTRLFRGLGDGAGPAQGSLW